MFRYFFPAAQKIFFPQHSLQAKEPVKRRPGFHISAPDPDILILPDGVDRMNHSGPHRRNQGGDQYRKQGDYHGQSNRLPAHSQRHLVRGSNQGIKPVSQKPEGDPDSGNSHCDPAGNPHCRHDQRFLPDPSARSAVWWRPRKPTGRTAASAR